MTTKQWDRLCWPTVIAFFIYCWQDDPEFITMFFSFSWVFLLWALLKWPALND